MTDTLAGDGLEASAGLSLAIGRLADSTDRLARQSKREVPIDCRVKDNGQFPGSGNLAFDLGGPQMGRVWLPRRLVVGGATWASAVAGTAEAYATALAKALVLANRPVDEIFDEATALPSVAFYSNRQVVLRYPERLVVVVVGGTPGTNYGAYGQVVDYAEATREEVYEL